jgi:hypothetical protein
MALGSTHPLTEMSTRNLPGGKERPARKADNLTAICEPIVWKMSWFFSVFERSFKDSAVKRRLSELPFNHITTTKECFCQTNISVGLLK